MSIFLKLIAQTFTVSEIEKAVYKIVSNKTTISNGIFNGVLQYALKILLSSIYKLVNVHLQQGYYPTYFKETVMVILWTLGKDDYSIYSHNHMIWFVDFFPPFFSRQTQRVSMLWPTIHLMPHMLLRNRIRSLGIPQIRSSRFNTWI